MRHRGLGVGVFAALILACLIPMSATAHHPVKTVEGHIEEDSVAVTPAMEEWLGEQTEAATEADAERAAAGVAGDEAEVGRWGPVIDWPVVGIHMALLQNGKVLAYDSSADRLGVPDQSFTRATVWNPGSGRQTDAMLSLGFNIFCSGLAHLMDGTLFTAGGNEGARDGISKTYTFDEDGNTWTEGADMAEERWYPTVTPLQNGEMLITDGVSFRADAPEVRETDGAFRSLTDAAVDLELYPWIDVAPDGRAFVSGPDAAMRSLDPSGTGDWDLEGSRGDSLTRSYGSHALYDIGKILVAGGGPSTASALTIDLNEAAPEVAPTAPMETGRRQHNLTVLADGSVLATGGNSSGEPLIDMENGVYTAELWDPATGEWTTLDSMQVTRQYHSSALLLPNGRVLSAGGGICGDCTRAGYLAKNAEVFTPPYLYKGDGSGELARRPRIASAPRVVDYGEPMTVGTSAPRSIGKVAMVRLGAVTHSVNMEQRYVPLSFTARRRTLGVETPANPNIAPPGVYMLFVLKPNGVPSVARMIRIAEGGGPDNTFNFGKVQLNKRNGSAGLRAKVAGAGRILLSATKQVKGAEATAGGPRTVKLAVRPKGATKRKLTRRGVATVKLAVTFTPTGGDPRTKHKTLKLVKR